jgi:hypothetical protein
MKLETAKALTWPWETREFFADKSVCPAYYIAKPSVEEMLERMPPTVLRSGVGLTGTKYYIASSRHDELALRGQADDPSEALALLCIWLRDNKLMEWKP